ncbi:MAG: alpha/beta hydrolase, partial [Herbiconiux sp.]|nr:alpha/beta hydrolase [Herbiconiux sp.]
MANLITDPAQTLHGSHFVMLDGWQHRRAPLHWQGWLAERLVERGATVDYLTLPDPEHPRYAAWSAAVLGALDGRSDVTVVAHGLSVLLWLRLCGERGVRVVADATSTGPAATDGAGTAENLVHRVVLVAPPASGLHGGDVSAPLPASVTPQAVAAASVEPPLLVWSPDDPYLPEGAAARYGAPLRIDSVEVPAGAHLNAASGYGPWPAMLAWCETGVWPEPESAVVGKLEIADPTDVHGADGEVAGRGGDLSESDSSFHAELGRLFAPTGRRLGIVVAGDIGAGQVRAVDEALQAYALEPERRRALLQPRVGERTLRASDVAEFGALYGHEYSVAVLDGAL